MESRFQRDFSPVRIHFGSEAAQSAQALGAKAYTAGHDIVLNSGALDAATSDFHSPKGQRLLVHELAHVVQYEKTNAPKGIGSRGDRSEVQADRLVDSLGWGGLRHQYGTVSRMHTPHPGERPPPAQPDLTAATAQIQRVQLTYDDGPDSAGNTRKVLDALNAAGARGTFYLVGKRVAQGDNWRIVFDIAAAGHWLGNHAFDWNDAADEHIFLSGTAEERAQKIILTEWAIRDSLIRGRDDAKSRNAWSTIPAANRAYIEDVIARGTGRFRTPGFKSHTFHEGSTITLAGATTGAAIDSANQVLAATGLRPLARTYAGTLGEEGVDIDPKDWEKGRKQSEIESNVSGKLSSNSQSILLHSRIGATAAATPKIVSDIQSHKFTFDPTPQGAIGSMHPQSGFAGVKLSDPPTAAEVASVRAYLKSHMAALGPFVSGQMAVRIFQLAQRVSAAEVNAFAAEIKGTKISTPDGPVPMANWLNANEEWRLFSSLFENWNTNAPFPRIPGVTQ
jgi:peptidoglycan/xylan/chitin deacetylase (PgdA/CDA1 family)